MVISLSVDIRQCECYDFVQICFDFSISLYFLIHFFLISLLTSMKNFAVILIVLNLSIDQLGEN